MEQLITFAVDEIQKIDMSDYSDAEFAVARVGFLSTRPNSHGYNISEEVLRECAPSVLGKWMVVKMDYLGQDATTHEKDECIVGQFPREQEVEFIQDDEGYLRAYADAVISKIYAQEYCSIFERDNERAVSVEMKIVTDEDDESKVLNLNIVGVTTLGKTVNPSCPESDVKFIRFSDDDAGEYFNRVHLGALKKFAKERKDNMAENKSYKVDKSKEAISEKAWGEVDKTDLRNKIMDAKNKNSLVKSVYMLVEEGWEDAPSDHLKYPVMCFEGDKLVYNRYGLASALAYARQENETAVINKIERIYKKLDINKDSQGKEEDAKMSKEIEFAAVDIGDLWGRVWDAIHAKYPDGEYGCAYRIEGIYEEDNKKFAIIRHRDEDSMYRLDLSLTEDGLTIADEIIKVELDIIETDTVKKFAEPENAKVYTEFEDIDDGDKDDDDDEKDEDPDNDDGDDDEGNEVKMSEDEMMEKIHQLEKDIEEKEHIIMANENELKELREFKQARLEADRAKDVESVMAEIKEYLDEGAYTELRQEGLMCEFSEIDAWANKAKAQCFNLVKGTKPAKKSTGGIWGFSAPIESISKKKSSIWDD